MADKAGSLRDGIATSFTPAAAAGGAAGAWRAAVSTPDESNYPADRSALRTSPPDLRVPSLAHA